jgi:exosortase
MVPKRKMSDYPQTALPARSSDRARTVRFPWGRLVSGEALVFIALGVCWLLFFNEIRGEWEINPQYSYGYVVPLLGAALLWRRWPDRPAAMPGASPLMAVAVLGLLLLQLPSTLVFEANPEWRLLYWFDGFKVVGLSFALLYRLGGRPWVRHFAPALVFMLIAVPWPMEWEQGVIQGLMRFVAELTVVVANSLGIPAIQHGNLIEVGAGWVGIDEACSGVRSLQSALMLSLFLGEMYRFSSLRRLVLLAASLFFVLLANLTRTTLLVWTAANHGLHQMETWHDTVGNVIMLIVLPCLMGMAYLMKPKTPEITTPSGRAQDVFPQMPRWVGLSVLGWLLLVQLATEGWYRCHEASLIPNTPWSLVWPVQDLQFKKTSVPENSLAILRCSDSQAATWQDNDGNGWSAFLLRWNPGKNSEQLAKGHRPDICFPAAGAQLVDDFGRVTLDLNGVAITFRHQSFASGSKLLHVFYCLWSDRVSAHENSTVEDGSQLSRIRDVMAGKRNLGQQVLEIVIQGPDSDEDAVNLLKQQLPHLIKRG